MPRRALRDQGYSDAVIDTLLWARRSSSEKLYKTYLDKWQDHCDKSGTDLVAPPLPEALSFLQKLKDDPYTHRGYSAICTARSALSTVLILPDGTKFMEHPVLKQFCKGVFNIEPPKPRYVSTWDTSMVTDLLKGPGWYPARKLSLLKLSQKVVTLILLITGQRGNIINALSTETMDIQTNCFTFTISNEQIKQGRPGYKPGLLSLKSYPDKTLCVVNYIKQYL